MMTDQSKENPIIQEAIKVAKKENLTQWVKDNVGRADKCLVVFASHKPEGGIELVGAQVGFQYIYEIDGFVQMVPEIFTDDDAEEAQENGER